MAEQLPPDPPIIKKKQAGRYTHLKKKSLLDLQTADINSKTTRLVVDRIKKVSGWKTIQKLGELDSLSVVLCKMTSAEKWEPPIAVRSLNINSCDDMCLRTLLLGMQAEELEVIHYQSPLLDLSMLRNYHQLTKLFLGASLIRNTSSLKELPLKDLMIGKIMYDDEFFNMLDSIANTLELLSVSTTQAFLPSELPQLSKLKRMYISGYPEVAKQWIDYAVANPHIAFRFGQVSKESNTQISVEEIYKGIDILKIIKGKKMYFEIATDITSQIKGYRGSNGDVEDKIRPLAKKAKIHVRWSSEADTFVAMTDSIESCQWIIDAALGLCKR